MDDLSLSEIKRIHREIDSNIGPADDSEQAEFDESLKVSNVFVLNT